MRVVAILASYNEERFIGGCLEHLIEQGVEPYLIDNCSTDRTVEIASKYLGRGLINVETLSRPDGLHRWNRILQRKEELTACIDADWFMHMDPDEIRLPPHLDQTLAEAFAEVDALGYNAVNFLEFTFIPTRESPEHDHPNFQQTMKWYYPFIRNFPWRVNAWKHQSEPIQLQPGGHRVRFSNLCLYPESFKMRHYQFLSLEQARIKYLEKKQYDPATIKSKSFWRAWLVEERMGLPSQSELNTYTSDDELSLANPRTRHVMEDWALPEANRKEDNLQRSSGSYATPRKPVAKEDKLLVVYPQARYDLYKKLGQRLVTACKESSRSANLVSAAAVCDLDKDQLSDTTVAMLGPAQCYWNLPSQDSLSLRLSEARGKFVVFAESVETEYFGNQFKVPVDFDALIDVGFVSQEEKLGDFDLPYRLLFNSPTRGEKRRIEQASLSGREIPWAMIGHNKGGRVDLAHKLMQRFDPRGFVFLPQSGISVREDRGMIGPEGLDTLLHRTRYYIWKSLHEFAYYESFRFREAILAGAVPCKIEDEIYRWERRSIPGIFPSLESFIEAVDNEGFERLYESAREFYLSRGLLADHLDEVLESV